MAAITLPAGFYSVLAVGALLAHALFILWVIFGAFLAASRPWLRRLHFACLVWGVMIEVLPWPCPLTPLENWLEQKAGIEPYQGGFLLHYLDKLVYPDVPQIALIIFAAILCLLNIAYYSRQRWKPPKPDPLVRS